jgi:hypothetical protein
VRRTKPFASRMHTTIALTHLAANYNNGQRSRGYRLLCRLLHRCQRHGIIRPLDKKLSGQRAKLYKELEKKYAEKL